MSKADEMFEELKYKKYENKEKALLILIQYKSKENTISFWADKTLNIDDNINNSSGYITMQELQAINEKVKELRMDRKSVEYSDEQDLGTKRYNIMINKKYIVDFEETESKKGVGCYSNGAFSLTSPRTADRIVVSNKKSKAYVFEGKTNLKSCIDKLLSNSDYKFYNIEIIEME